MVIPFRHGFDYLPKILEQQSKNGLALALGPTQTFVAVINGTSRAAFKAATRLMIEFMGGDFDRQNKVMGNRGCEWPSFHQRGFQVPDAFFHAPVVTRPVWWIVQGQHPEPGEEFIHGVMIEGRAVVAFEEQRRAVLAKETFQMGRDLPPSS